MAPGPAGARFSLVRVYAGSLWPGGASGDAAAVINVIRKLRNAKDSFAGSSRPWVPGGGPLPGL